MPEKPAKTFRISEQCLKLLDILAKSQNRTPANMLETLILQAAEKEKIKVKK